LSERDPRAEAVVLVRKAEEDANAMRLLADAEISDEIVGFHAQQAVEKWLKAVLGSRGIEFEYTHDLRRLIAEVTAVVGESRNWSPTPANSAELLGQNRTPWSRFVPSDTFRLNF
jgi:HEPN domain-containing protein